MKRFLAAFLCVLMALSLFALSGCAPDSDTPNASESPESPDVSDAGSYPAELTENQLFDFQNRLSASDNYGFLFSAYDDVRDADLNQIFYTGAGMSAPENYDAITEAYLKVIGETELFTDCTVLTTRQIDDFLSAKTGNTLSSMTSDFSWTYVEEYDAYVSMHGDTNYLNISVVGGKQIDENVFEVEYCFDGGFYDDNGDLMTGGAVRVKTDGPSMMFVMNSLHA